MGCLQVTVGSVIPYCEEHRCASLCGRKRNRYKDNNCASCHRIKNAVLTTRVSDSLGQTSVILPRETWDSSMKLFIHAWKVHWTPAV